VKESGDLLVGNKDNRRISISVCLLKADPEQHSAEHDGRTLGRKETHETTEGRLTSVNVCQQIHGEQHRHISGRTLEGDRDNLKDVNISVSAAGHKQQHEQSNGRT
jgi:hypothetical protein